MSDESISEERWYQSGWVWLVFSIPFTAVLFGVVMFTSANYQPDDVVVDNYYKEGMGINQRLAMDRQAAQLGIKVRLVNLDEDELVFAVDGAGDLVKLSLFHVSDKSKDSFAIASRDASGLYRSYSEEIVARLQSPGIWYIEVSGQDWRLRERIQTPVTDLEMGSG